jgi:prefoldin subunit 5
MAATQDRNVTSAVCRSTPNGLNNLNTEIDQCTSSVELNRNTNFAANTFKLQKDISTLSAAVGDSLVMGDSVFGQIGAGDVIKQLKNRIDELKHKKEELKTSIDKDEAVIERADRDFSDVKDTLPETQPKKVLHFIEDYTLAILLISYLFMVIAAIYVYTLVSDNKLVAFGKAFLTSIFISCFMFMMLYFFT